MTQIVQNKIYTSEAYLEMELKSPERHEYVNGEIRLMTGGTPEHNKIVGALHALLWFSLRSKPYDTYVTDQRLWIPACGNNTYPDVMVVKTPLVLQDGRTDTVTNPCFIAEVLSKATRDYDRGGKFAAYRTIPTFREYMLIDQYSDQIAHYVKTAPNQWLMSEYDVPDINLSLETLDCQLQISELYQDLDFSRAVDGESPSG